MLNTIIEFNGLEYTVYDYTLEEICLQRNGRKKWYKYSEVGIEVDEKEIAEKKKKIEEARKKLRDFL